MAAAAARPTRAAASSPLERAYASSRPAEIAFPALVRGDMPAAPSINWQRINWLSPRPMHQWPLVLDFDTPDTFTQWRKRIE
ncbi:MAG TPA: hypothetical protein VGH47_00705 [Xanthobacteraceae bacterium]